MANRPFYGSFSIGQSQRRSLSQDIISPGPGAYDFKIQKNQSYKFSFPKQQRSEKITEQQMIKSNYKIQFESNSNIKFTMGQRYKPKYEYPMIGPGAYNPKQLDSSYKQISFGYKLDSAFTPKPEQISITDQKSQEKTQDKEQEKSQKSNEKHIPQKMNYRSKSEDHFQQIHKLNKPDVPGPGSYNLNYNVKNSTACGFGTASRSQKYHDDNMPSVGKYSINSSINTNKKFTLSQKIYLKDYQNDTPGPIYNPVIQDCKLPIKIAISQRRSFSQSNLVPGPIYEHEIQPNFNGTVQNTFGNAQRFLKSELDDNPGPGEYKIDSINDSRNVFFTSRPVQKMMRTQMGPGYYEIKSQFNPNSTQGFRISKSQREVVQKSKKCPGPGQYEISQINFVQAPRFSFGVKLKTKSQQQNGFEYNIQNTIGYVPSYLKEEKRLQIQQNKQSKQMINNLEKI